MRTGNKPWNTSVNHAIHKALYEAAKVGRKGGKLVDQNIQLENIFAKYIEGAD